MARPKKEKSKIPLEEIKAVEVKKAKDVVGEMPTYKAPGTKINTPVSVVMRVCQGSHCRLPDTEENFPPEVFQGRYSRKYLEGKDLI